MCFWAKILAFKNKNCAKSHQGIMVYIIYTSRIASKVSKVIKFWRGDGGILQDDPNAN
jgi:hypothetical protein